MHTKEANICLNLSITELTWCTQWAAKYFQLTFILVPLSEPYLKPRETSIIEHFCKYS